MRDEARLFLQAIKNNSEGELLRYADEFLSYFHRLHDQYGITRSTSPRFSGKTFIILEDIIYELESHPEETLKSPSSREFIVDVLEDIANGRIILQQRKS